MSSAHHRAQLPTQNTSSFRTWGGPASTAIVRSMVCSCVGDVRTAKRKHEMNGTEDLQKVLCTKRASSPDIVKVHDSIRQYKLSVRLQELLREGLTRSTIEATLKAFKEQAS